MAKVLVVDDDSNFRDILERAVLRSYTYAVSAVATEAEAWKELERHPYDLVLLDLYIDGRKSWDTLKRIGRLPAGPSVIMVSCEDTRENLEYAKSLGAMDFIAKPIDFGRLKSTIDDVLRWGEKQDLPVQRPSGARSPGGEKEMRILIVDGEMEVRDSMKKILAKASILTFDAKDGDHARKILQGETFDAILVGVKGSNTAGDETLKNIRGVEGSSLRLPVIAVTDGSPATILAALSAGADDYIAPPVDTQILASKVKAHVRLRREYDRRLEQVVALCVKDVITGSYNHSYFRTRLQEEFDRSVRYKRNLSLAFLGLDPLEQVKSVFGPSATDRILSDVSSVIHKGVRSSDIVARYEEGSFALLMPEATSEAVVKKAGAIRSQVEEQVAYNDGRKTDLFCSVGLASLSLFSPDGKPGERVKSPEDLLGMANMALTRARMAGKGRVEVFGK